MAVPCNVVGISGGCCWSFIGKRAVGRWSACRLGLGPFVAWTMEDKAHVGTQQDYLKQTLSGMRVLMSLCVLSMLCSVGPGRGMATATQCHNRSCVECSGECVWCRNRRLFDADGTMEAVCVNASAHLAPHLICAGGGGGGDAGNGELCACGGGGGSASSNDSAQSQGGCPSCRNRQCVWCGEWLLLCCSAPPPHSSLT